jgi:Dcp1-like decapping family protein
MTPRRARDGRPGSINYQTQSQPHQLLQQSSAGPLDYESDSLYFPDAPQHSAGANLMPPPPTRSNEELNLSVLRRHNASIASILSLAPYAVVYIFSPTTKQWEKSGVEGSMFVYQLVQGPLGEDRYGVLVLNRRGLNNFDIRLTDGENVELTEEYVILKIDDNDVEDSDELGGGRQSGIYGLWIYSEPPPNSTSETRSINAQVIKECAVHAGRSMILARERDHENGHPQPPFSSVPMGRQISLKELFGQQRAQDDEWSVKVHSPSPLEPERQIPPSQRAEQDVLGNLFRRAGLAYQAGQKIS